MAEPKSLFQYPSIYGEIEGQICAPYVKEEDIDEIIKLPLREDDIIVGAWPKSGQTWLMEILQQIRNNGILEDTPLYFRYPYLETFSLQKTLKFPIVEKYDSITEYINSWPSPRLLKTHLQYHQVPKVESSVAKYIYIIRNPKDAAVSYYYHHRRTTWYQFAGEWDDFFEMLIRDRVEHGSWFDHVLGWWEHRDDPKILFLKYENMKKDPLGCIRTVAEFTGRSLEDEMMERIMEHTRFEFMTNLPYFNNSGPMAKTAVPGETKFVRKGIVGDWRNHFTDEQNRIFDEVFTKRMAGSGLEIEF